MPHAKIMLLFCLLASIPASSQFQLNGNAVQTSADCYRLTIDQDNQSGSIWNPEKIDLRRSFDVIFDIFLGCKDNGGADGIVFGFQPTGTSLGMAGGGIGFQNVSPSIGIEFDTYQNGGFNDPGYDHIAIIRDGNLNHNSVGNLAGPLQVKTNVSDIEDCLWHWVRVSWQADIQRLEVSVDCEFRLAYEGDIVQEIFGGDPWVFWGFTSATGASNNVHEVCLRYTTFLEEMEDVVLCPNGQVQLQAASGYSSYQWSPETGLSNPGIRNPVASPVSTTDYVVEILDECKLPFYDSVTVLVDGDTSFVDLGPDTTICEFETLLLDAGHPNATYLWSTGSTGATLEPATSGNYAVTVTLDDYCQDFDRVGVTILPVPTINFPVFDSLCIGTTLTLDASIADPDALYTWQDGSGLPTYEVSKPGIYEVNIVNRCGEASGAVALAFEDCRAVYFPNAFTPDFDGINDTFFPMDEGDVEEVEVLHIFDRWGDLVFQRSAFYPNDEAAGWDGRVRGANAPTGVYVWVAKLRFKDGFKTVRSGALHLIR